MRQKRTGADIMRVFIRKQIRLFTAVGCILMLTRLASAAPDTASIKTEIVGMPLGTSIELRLNRRAVEIDLA
jgi:hypothetical protein